MHVVYRTNTILLCSSLPFARLAMLLTSRCSTSYTPALMPTQAILMLDLVKAFHSHDVDFALMTLTSHLSVARCGCKKAAICCCRIIVEKYATSTNSFEHKVPSPAILFIAHVRCILCDKSFLLVVKPDLTGQRTVEMSAFGSHHQ